MTSRRDARLRVLPRWRTAAARSVCVLGPHRLTAAGGSVVRTHRSRPPRGPSIVRLVATRRAPCRCTRRRHGLFELTLPGDGPARLPPARHVPRRPRGRDRRSVSLRPGAHRLRSAPARRRHASIARSRSSARTDLRVGSTVGVHFAVWAPNADRVSVVGDFNGWDGRVHPMRLLVAGGRLGAVRPGSRRTARSTSSRSARAPARCSRRAIRSAWRSRRRRRRRRSSATSRGYAWDDDEWMARATASRAAGSSADVDLRGAPRLVGARARGRQSLSDLSRAGRAARAVREGARASRTSSCCR